MNLLTGIMERARMPEKKWSGVHKTNTRASLFPFLLPRRFSRRQTVKFKNSVLLYLRHSTVISMTFNGLPHYARGRVVKGFGRGSKELGIPTANLPAEEVTKLPPELSTGVYYGWARVDNGPVYKMVMSIGWNPYYKNKEKSMEIHILNVFENDFYGCTLSIIMLGYVRPELDFDSLESLIKTIRNDIAVAEKELDKPEYYSYQYDKYLTTKVEMTCDCNQNLRT